MFMLAIALTGPFMGLAPLHATPGEPPAARDSSAEARNVATFDAVWVIIRDKHWDPTLGGLDWEKVRVELLPAAAAAKTPEELRAVLHQMLGKLGQSHFAILPGEELMEQAPVASTPQGNEGKGDTAAPAATEPVRVPKRHRHDGITGATITLLQAAPSATPQIDTTRSSAAPVREAVVTRVDPGTPAANAGIVPGMVLLSIDGKSVVQDLPSGEGLERYEAEAIADARTTGEPGATTTWRVRAPDGSERDIKLAFAADTRPTTKFGNLPTMPVSLQWSLLDPVLVANFQGGSAKIGSIAFDAWFVPIAKPFDQAIDALRESDALVIDLRGNPGGFGGMAMGIAGHFTPTSETLGTMYMRGSTLNFVTNPRRVSSEGKPVKVFERPVAILVDVGTASTSEIFAGGMQHLGRARIFGSRTAGAALPAVFDELPNGDVFLHAIADYRLPNGQALEAAGVRPDLERMYTSVDYARDGDPVLADAIRWIAAERAKRADAATSTSLRTQEKTP